MSAAGIFQLNTSVELPDDLRLLPPLGSVQTSFQLPSLSESESSVNRLLESLKSLSLPAQCASYKRSPKSKGKEKETPPTDTDGIAIATHGDHAFWLRASEDQPGPSSGRLFQSLHTWDAHSNNVPAPHMLSEGSMFTFDALIASQAQPPLPKMSSTSKAQTRDTGEMLRLLMRATLGSTTTGGIAWSKRDNRFHWTKTGPRLEGLEPALSTTSINTFLDVATRLRRLELFIDSLSSKPMTPTHHSFVHALSTYLTLIKRNLTTTIETSFTENVPALMRQTSDLHGSSELLTCLCELIQWPMNTAKPVPLPSRPASILDKVYAQLLAQLLTVPRGQAEHPVALALAYILSRSSRPLMDLLHQWIGLAAASPADEDADPDSQPWSDLGITRHATSASAGSIRWDYTFSANRMPRFIPKTDRRTLFEAGKSLRLLRDASANQHPLCAGGWDLYGEWGWGSESPSTDHLRSHTRRIQREIEYWRRSVKGIPKSLSTASSFPQLREPRKSRKRLPLDFTHNGVSPSSSSPAEGHILPSGSSASKDAAYVPIWELVIQQPGTHLSTARQTLWSATPLASLEAFIAYHNMPDHPLLSEEAPTLPQHISFSLLAPLLVHADLVSTALVAHFLDDLAFLDHLDVLRAHWLGGDVAYLERVNAALFGRDAAGAGEALGLGKRARTRARLGLGDDDVDNDKADEQREWGIGLGIGLSERAQWPPGGAELTYALRSAMVDDERTEMKVSEVWERIEDKVSYAIRDLPEDQRDGRRAKWLNPQAIEALDFLYLAYSPPPAISVLLPTTLMDKYQQVHNLLLRLGRVETVLRSLFVECHHRHDIFEQPLKTGVDAQYSRRRQDGTRQQRGIFPLGSRHETQLWQLRYRMSHFITSFSRYVLDIAIGANWDVLRRRLRRLQRKSRSQTGYASSSRPSTPTTDEADDHLEDFDDLDQLGDDDRDEDEQGTTHRDVRQLHSIHSLITYHQLTMDRVLRSCLLSPSAGHQVAFKVLMTLFSLVLDFGKTVKEVEKGLLGWEDGAERIEGYRREWVEKETVFLHAVERLSMRTTSDKVSETDQAGDHAETHRDLDLLLHGDRDGIEDKDEAREGMVLSRQGADLQELVMRIRIQTGPAVEMGRKRKQDDQV